MLHTRALFCPYCGKAMADRGEFCSSCGRRVYQTPQVEAAPPLLTAPIRALSYTSLYLIDNEGLLKIGTQFPLLLGSVVVGVGLAITAVALIGLGSWIALAVALTLVIAPIVSEYRARRLAELLSLPRGELALKKGVQTIPWSSVQFVAVKGRDVTLRLDGGWTSATLDAVDVPTLTTKASSILGDRFTSTPTQPSRLSPAMKLFLLTLFLFLMTQAILIAASLTPYFPGEQARYTSLYNSTKSGLGTSAVQEWGGIFFNNVQIALASLVPGFGFLILTVSSYNTGRVIQAAAAYYSVTPADFLLVLYILPHSWVEESSYPLSTALGMFAFTWRKQSYSEFANWRTRASVKIGLGFLVVATLLTIAATLEVTEPLLGTDALLLWVPVSLGAIICTLFVLSYLKRGRLQSPSQPP